MRRPGQESAPFAPVVLLVAAFVATTPSRAIAQNGAPQCQPSGQMARIAELPEGSGLAVSRRTPGRLWSHNDSGSPVLVAIDARGATTARVTVSGIRIDDWEAIAVGPCPGGSCLYLGDIGDNEARRKQIAVHRVAEPGDETTVAVRDTFRATYPDGAHDAEALLVTPDGTIYIVTKGETGDRGLYRFPKDLEPGGTHTLEQVGKPRDKASPADRITDGSVSPDGTWVVLRTRTHLTFHRPAELFAGNWTEAGRVELARIGEPQGEGVAIGSDGTVYLIGEGGGKKQPGTFVTLSCSSRPRTRQ